MDKEVFKQFPVFKTDRLIIRPFVLEDYESFIAWHRGDIVYYMDGLHYFEDGDLETYLRLFLKNVPRMFQTKESIIWCIAEKSTNKSIGKIELCKYDFNAETAQIHYCLAKEARGNGYMSEAVNCILNWAFHTLEANRIYTYVSAENAASANVLKKNGFILEGVMREASVNKYTIDGQEIKITKNDASMAVYKKLQNICIYGCLKREFHCKV
jgi:[ribosomal protein S5]-alanine N-acetyltransferase